jgi:hypothetical protein
VRYQLRHAPELRGGLYPRRPASTSAGLAGDYAQRVPLTVLFSCITVGFAAIAVWSAEASRWPIALAAAALAAWMGSVAWAALRKTRS